MYIQQIECFAAGFESVSVLVQRPHMPPVRCGFWRASTCSLEQQPQGQPLKHPQPLTSSQTHAEAQMQPNSVSVSPLGSPRNNSEGNSSLSREVSEGKMSLSREKTEGSFGLHRGGSDGKPPKHRPAPLPPSSTSSGTLTFGPDVLLAAVEPFGAEVLELQKLDGFRGRIGYSPTRNRQCHMYTITERPNARSAPLKRVFLRYALPCKASTNRECHQQQRSSCPTSCIHACNAVFGTARAAMVTVFQSPDLC